MIYHLLSVLENRHSVFVYFLLTFLPSIVFAFVSQSRYDNKEEAKAIPTRILQGWEDLTKKGKALINQREQMEAYAQDVINRYELGKKGLDIEEQKLIKDIVLGMLEIASKGAGAALGAKVGKTGIQ